MSRFKFGLVIGFGVGWLVATGRAAELFDEAKARITSSKKTDGASTDAGGVYDFAVRAAQ